MTRTADQGRPWPTSGGGSPATTVPGRRLRLAGFSEWGDAQITFLGRARPAGAPGIGGFILDRLEDEAAARGLNYIYNVVPASHPDPDRITGWLTRRGFVAGTGDLRRQVSAAARRPVTQPAQ